MADYNKFKNINTGSLRSAASELKSKISSSKSKLSSFQGSLSDSIWKANAKNTLFTAFDTINGEVVSEIEKSLESANTIAGYIDDYNDAKAKAEAAKSDLDYEKSKPEEERSSSTISNLESKIRSAEADMETAVNNVNSALS